MAGAEGVVAVEITEVSEGGSVPELQVVNETGRHVLLFDGEELKGAKQNRILNSTILVEAGSRLTVPVSCTESGRWSYQSDEFALPRGRGLGEHLLELTPCGVRRDAAVARSLVEGEAIAEEVDEFGFGFREAVEGAERLGVVRGASPAGTSR